MAQGKAWDKEKVIEALEPLFKMGMSVNKACNAAGFPQSTVQTWIDNSEELRLKIGIWQAEPSRLARSSWLAKIAEGDYIASRDWLTKKEKDEFSERTEMTGKDGKELPAPIISIERVSRNNSPDEDSSTE